METRRWQEEATRKYFAELRRNWLLCATPGAGKTFWALNIAKQCLDRGLVKRVVVVAPTQTVRDQWANQTTVHLEIVANADGGTENAKDFQGCVVTYAQVASQPDLHRHACMVPTLVILDEIHHAGDEQSWGTALKTAFEVAEARLGLTGTPWRRKNDKIPFVTYGDDGTVQVDFAYEYGSAVADDVCRTIQFHAFDGEVTYVDVDTCVPQPKVFRLTDDEDDRSSILRDLLDPSRPWIPSMLRLANDALTDIRSGDEEIGAVRDAKGLVVVDRQQHAKVVARLLQQITGEAPEVITSDEPDAKAAIDRFRANRTRWAVAVDMFSEGVDVPALYTGVYATTKMTPLRFRQTVGRFVRKRKGEERDAVLFMPAVPTLMTLASDIQQELRHMVGDLVERYEREARENADAQEEQPIGFIVTGTSEGIFTGAIKDGKTYSGGELQAAITKCEEYEIPTSHALKIAKMLRDLAGSGGQRAQADVRPDPEMPDMPLHKLKAALRKALDTEAGKKGYELFTGREGKKEINLMILKRFGKERHKMDIEQLREALRYVQSLS